MRAAAVVFDLGDTVVHAASYDREAGISALLAHAEGGDGISVEQIARRGEEIDSRLEASCVAENLEYRQTDFHRLLYGSFGIRLTLPDREAEQLYWRSALSMDCEPGIEEALMALEAQGIRRAVISNAVYSGETLSGELERKGLLRYFEFVISSADYGLRKPDPLLFSVAGARLGLPAERCMYVGNLIHVDVEGALRSGWRAGWYAAAAERNGDFDAEYAGLPEGVAVWKSWKDFRELYATR
jgi:putative hydrolase of the HAD superfamily